MIAIENNKLDDKINNIIKAIEVLGGNCIIKDKNKVKEELVLSIINSVLNDQVFKININDREYNLKDIEKEKLNYEKHILKNKNKIIQYIVLSIKRNNKELSSKIKKYFKEGDLNLYKDIENKIKKVYKNDINTVILASCNINFHKDYEENLYYGEYLESKREQIIQSIINKM